MQFLVHPTFFRNCSQLPFSAGNEDRGEYWISGKQRRVAFDYLAVFPLAILAAQRDMNFFFYCVESPGF